MENQDIKLFNQFKKAAEKETAKEFPAMESVWNTIETKLDNQVLKKQNKTWKKWAVAASVLLVGSIAFQLLKSNKPENEIIQTKEQNKIVVAAPITEDSMAVAQKKNTPKSDKIVENPHEVLKTEMGTNTNSGVAVAETVAVETKKEAISQADEAIAFPNKDESYKSYLRNNGNTANTTVSNGYAKMEDKYTIVIPNTQKESKAKAQKPLVVKDGELVNQYDEDAVDIETIVSLPNPLYVINGVRYTENELYGDNPTSPYYPLKKQKITSCTVLKPEEAIKAYGPEGANGVVIITTQDGKPRK